MLRVLSRTRHDTSRETTRVLFFRPDRPRAIDRIIRYFGDAAAATPVAMRPLVEWRPRQP
jgi:hypothetical protein